MKYSVEIADQAEADLRGIYEYIAKELRSAQNAAAQISRLEHDINSLSQMPERFRRYEKEPWSSQGWRIMPVDRYCVFYIADRGRGIVKITRILYGGRDIANILSKGSDVGTNEKTTC